MTVFQNEDFKIEKHSIKITIKRPNGEIEEVYKTDSKFRLKKFQDQAYKATKEVGRGEILNFEDHVEELDMTLSEIRKELLDRWSDARKRDFNRDIVQAAEQAVKDFDVAHPEIKASIKWLYGHAKNPGED